MAARTGIYSVPLRFRHTAADASGSFIWCLRGGTDRVIVLRKVLFNVGFDGTVAATESEYELVRLNAITAFSAGTQRVPAKMIEGMPASGVSDVRDNAVLTVTGGTVIATLAAMGATRQVQHTHGRHSIYYDENGPQIDKGSANGFALRLNAAAVIGDHFRGLIEWEER